MDPLLDCTDLSQLQGSWNYPTTIHFGIGKSQELAKNCQELAIQHPLIVTDAELVKLDFVAEIDHALQEASLESAIFSAVKPNPTGSNVKAGVAVYEAGKHDGVIALGGGSALDAGKTIALMIGQKHDLWSFEDVGDNWKQANVQTIAPIIAIPTTAGTGSEVGRCSVIVDEKSQKKRVIFHPKMMPELVIADPQLTQGLPAQITAATGLDAFTHSLEAYCVPGYHPMADGIALESMRLIKEWLPLAVQDGNHLAARSHMLVASTMGATAFQKGLGSVHALAHPLGALYDAHHGLLNAILLPYVLRKNQAAIKEKIRQVAKVLSLSNPSFQTFFDWLIHFRQQLQIPNTLGAIGIQIEGQSELVGKLAVADPTASGNPISLTAVEYAQLFEQAVRGE